MSVFDDSGDCNGPAVSEARRKGHSKLYVKDGKIVSEAADRAARTSGPKGGRDNMKQLPESDSPKQGEDLLDFFQRRLEEGSPVIGKGQSDMIATVTTEPRYPALAFAVERVSNFTDRIKCNTELSDAERMAQPAPCGKLEHSGTLTFSGARGPECLLCSQTAEIERLRKQVKQVKIEGREEILKTYDGTIAVPLESWRAQCVLLTRLAGASNEIKGMIERNEIVRNTQADYKTDYILRMMDFVTRLKEFDAALAEARAAGVKTE